MASSCEDKENKWSEGETVIFFVRSRYDPLQPIICEYKLHPQYFVQSRDYVALYPAEEFHPRKSLSNYITWQWADISGKNDRRTITLSSRYLPQASQTLLLFAYVSWSDGVIGSSDTFQILHSCGDPVSIVSTSTDKSSFVILEKSQHEHPAPEKFNSEKTQRATSRSQQTALVSHSNDGRSDTPQSQTPQELKEMESVSGSQLRPYSNISGSDEGRNSEDCEICISEAGDDREGNTDIISAAAVPGTRDEEESGDRIQATESDVLKEIEQRVGVGISHISDAHFENVAKQKEDNSHLHLQLMQEMDKSSTMEAIVERSVKHNEALVKRIGELEVELGKRVTESAMLTRPSSKEDADSDSPRTQIEKLTKENHYLVNTAESLQTRLQASEHSLSQAKVKVQATKSKIRDLEHALIRERLSYESNLRQLAVDREDPTSDSSMTEHTSEDEYHTALEGECEEEPREGLPSHIPTSQRSTSALVRLGIEDERENTQERSQSVRKQYVDICCPICSKSSSSFRDHAAFNAHVNEHFSD